MNAGRSARARAPSSVSSKRCGREEGNRPPPSRSPGERVPDLSDAGNKTSFRREESDVCPNPRPRRARFTLAASDLQGSAKETQRRAPSDVTRLTVLAHRSVPWSTEAQQSPPPPLRRLLPDQ